MAQVEESRDREKRHIPTPLSNFPRDLLQRFKSANHLPVKLEEPSEDTDADAEELELTLGLSLNGRFGVDPRAKKIKRASSIPEFVNAVRDEDMAYVVPMACTPLIRTCSLPTETEEEWRKRKELQTLRRMEARRKRSEKQRNLKALRERNRALSDEIGVDDNYKRSEGVEGNNQAEQGAATLNEFTTRRCGLGFNGEKGSALPPPSSSQGSIVCQGISESECQPGQGTKSVDARRPIGANSLTDEQKLSVTAGTAVTMRNQYNKLGSPTNRAQDNGRNPMEDMPCVYTKGEGPSGKRIQGFLYRYGKGEEVRIVCVCHGSFLTPAEFVKHAGGGDVAHPMRHIVVNPSLL